MNSYLHNHGISRTEPASPRDQIQFALSPFDGRVTSALLHPPHLRRYGPIAKYPYSISRSSTGHQNLLVLTHIPRFTCEVSCDTSRCDHVMSALSTLPEEVEVNNFTTSRIFALCCRSGWKALDVLETNLRQYFISVTCGPNHARNPSVLEIFPLERKHHPSLNILGHQSTLRQNGGETSWCGNYPIDASNFDKCF